MSDTPVELTETQRMDLVIVARAENAPEAMYLVEVLSEAGIPALSEENNALGISGQQGAANIRVPRVLLDLAKTVIDAARAKAYEKRIENSFDRESVAMNYMVGGNDPAMNEMFLLLAQPFEFREMQLRKYVWNWLIDGASALEVATYLAAAGLTQDQAATLVETVKEEQAGELAVLREQRRKNARDLIFAGVGLFLGLAVVAIITRAAVVLITFGPLLFGAIALHRQARPVATLPRRSTWDGT